MRTNLPTRFACLIAFLCTAHGAFGQTLYTEGFDVAINPNTWTVNASGNGTDKTVDYFFDYSTVGIPSAPNSTGGSTRGMKLQANLSANIAGGINVSPNGKSFTGDYALRFDLWSNFIGAEVGSTDPLLDGLWEGGGSSTKFSLYGILSSGVGENYMTGGRLGVAEALYFANSGDGQSGFDFRVHGPGTATDHGPGGFRSTVETGSATPANNYDPVLDAGVSFADTYPVGHPDEGLTNRGVFLDPTVPFDPNDSNITDGFLYQAAFPSVAAPGQAALYPATQFDTTMTGAAGMAWRQMEIKKQGNTVTWSVLNAGSNGTTNYVLATVDLSQLKVPANSGNNIMFGESDPTSNVGTDPDFAALQFTLIDNIRVVALTPTEDTDFNNDGIVDGADLLIWQRGFGISDGTALNGNGDANLDGNVNATDLGLVKGKFGGPPAVVTVGAVPEPASWASAAVALAIASVWRRSRSTR